MSRPSWDEYFIKFARLASIRSEDQSSQIGAVIVKNNRIISTGYNSLPSGVKNNEPKRHERPLKYLWMVHGEENAICSAAKAGISCEGASLYVTPFHPCPRCAREIAQAGIKEVIIETTINNPRYKEEIEVAKEIFDLCGVETRNFIDTVNFWV